MYNEGKEQKENKVGHFPKNETILNFPEKTQEQWVRADRGAHLIKRITPELEALTSR